MADLSQSLMVSAPAKLNLGLSVTTRRGDGFHEIETIMARIDLADSVEVTLVRVDRAAGTTSLPPGHEPVLDAGRQVSLKVVGPDLLTQAVPVDATNLVVKAAEGYLRLLGQDVTDGLHVHIELTKRVPVAAGLGGGSSDAAATLMALTRLLPAAIDVPALGLALGSDVPFFLTPWPAALARGRGERLSAIEVPAVDLVVVKPTFGVSAAEAYSLLAGFTPRLRAADIVTALAAGEEPGWRNALQPGVIRAYPEVRSVLAALKGAGLTGCIMSGSGSACFGVARSRAEAEDRAASIAAAAREAASGWLVLPASVA